MSEPRLHPVDDIPLEIWLQLIAYLPKSDIISLNRTNKFFHQFCSPLAFKSIIFHLHRIALHAHARDPNEDKSIIRHLEDRTSRFRSISNSGLYSHYVDHFMFNGNLEGMKALQATPRPGFYPPGWQRPYAAAVQSVIPGLATFVSLRTLHLRTISLNGQGFRVLATLPLLHTLHLFQVSFTDSTVCPLPLDDFSIGGWRSIGYEGNTPSPSPIDVISPTKLKSLNLRHEYPDNHSPILHSLASQLCPKLTNLSVELGWDDMEPFVALLNNSPELESLNVKWKRRLMADEIPQDVLHHTSLQRLNDYTGPVELVPLIFPNRPITKVQLSTAYWLWSGVDLEESATRTFSYLGHTSISVKELVILDRIHLSGVHFTLIAKYLPELWKLKIDAPAQSWRMNKLWNDLCSDALPLPSNIEYLEICTENVAYSEKKQREYFHSLSGLYPSLKVVSLGSDEMLDD
ncbi:hypothetical protein BJ165DRAFT_1445518 [Panaeolus papilionaceus]|nr:hypothetical protein BJ165DRAFT_1445518 [Panaeolus papilionaceus]